jgi:hypothetical protein
MHRGRVFPLTFALVLLLVSISFVPSASSAGPPTCLVSNERTDRGFRSLQPAINAAASGDTLIIKGTCVGSSEIGGYPGSSTDKALTLQGVSNKQFGVATLDGQGSGSVLIVAAYSGASAAINDLTIRNGTGGIFVQGLVTLARSTVSGNEGSGIDGFESTINLTDSTVSGNGTGITGYRTSVSANRSRISDNQGVGIAGGTLGLSVSDSTVSGNGGAGIVAGGSWHSPGGAHITDSTISGNSGSGVEVVGDNFLGGDSEVSIEGSTVSGNTTSGSGGGINVSGGWARVQISDSTVTGNTAAVDGGGIFALLSAVEVSIARSTISGNTAGRYGGGIAVSSGAYFPATLSLGDSTVTTNRATSGGGIYVDPASSAFITLTGTNTFTGNLPEDCVGVSGC